MVGPVAELVAMQMGDRSGYDHVNLLRYFIWLEETLINRICDSQVQVRNQDF